MLSKIIPFRKTKASAVGWHPDDLAECYRVVDLLSRSGLPISIDSGLTDEGEPWAIVLRDDTGDVLLHMARLNGTFVVVSAAGPIAQRGDSLRAVLDAAVRNGGLAMLTRHSAPRDSEILRLHPAALLAAFIAAALVHTQTSQAALFNARREEGGANRADDARPAGFAALSSPAALATAAASFAAVVAVLHATQANIALELTLEDFVQTALELEVVDAGSVHLSTAPIEFVNLGLSQDGILLPPATMSGRAPLGTRPDDAQTHLSLQAPVTPDLIPVAGASDTSRLFVQQRDGVQSLGLTRSEIDRASVTASDTADLWVASPARVSEVTVSSSLAKANTPAAGSAPETPFGRGGEDTPVVKGSPPVMGDEAGQRTSFHGELQPVIFKTAAVLLNLEWVVYPTGSADNVLTGTNTFVNSSGSNIDGFSGTQPSTVASGINISSAAENAALQQVPSEAYVVEKGSDSQIVTVQPAPASNAQFLLEFTNGTDHVVQVDRNSLASQLAGGMEIGDARKVVIFDAPWLTVKSFMLMPGVMMMEDDLLVGVNHTGLEMKGSPVTLDLGGGLTLTLLGVMDFGFS